jgi:threonyl-tRNA synthetase
MLIIGDREMEAGNVAARSRRDGEMGEMTIPAVIEKMQLEIAQKL